VVEQISVTILTKNSQKYLSDCLKALHPFSEIIILDNGSNDDTLKIAASYPNVKIVEHPFIGFGPLKNLAVHEARHDWILSIDSDEVATPELIASIQQLDPHKTDTVYSIARENHYRGKRIKCCGWHPDIVTRLFNRTHTRFSDAMVHESLIIHPHTKKERLEGTLKHYPFDNVESLIKKMQSYSTLYAEQNDKPSSPLKAFLRALFAFFKNYLLQKGIFYGYEGLLISVSNANGVFYKYMKLYEKQRKNR
jgi:glycosyltransferase involved in cell wall biosynthesis